MTTSFFIPEVKWCTNEDFWRNETLKGGCNDAAIDKITDWREGGNSYVETIVTNWSKLGVDNVDLEKYLNWKIPFIFLKDVHLNNYQIINPWLIVCTVLCCTGRLRAFLWR